MIEIKIATREEMNKFGTRYGFLPIATKIVDYCTPEVEKLLQDFLNQGAVVSDKIDSTGHVRMFEMYHPDFRELEKEDYTQNLKTLDYMLSITRYIDEWGNPCHKLSKLTKFEKDNKLHTIKEY